MGILYLQWQMGSCMIYLFFSLRIKLVCVRSAPQFTPLWYASGSGISTKGYSDSKDSRCRVMQAGIRMTGWPKRQYSCFVLDVVLCSCGIGGVVVCCTELNHLAAPCICSCRRITGTHQTCRQGLPQIDTYGTPTMYHPIAMSTEVRYYFVAWFTILLGDFIMVQPSLTLLKFAFFSREIHQSRVIT